MQRIFKYIILISIILLFSNIIALADQPVVYTLTWQDVVGKSLNDNLSLQLKYQDYRSQKLNVWKAVGDFLPSVSYQGYAINNIELPKFIFMGQQIPFGSEYDFQHSIMISYPIFTGGARWANWKAQKSLKKSLKEELSGKEDEVVLSALQAYFGITLASSLRKVSQEAVDAAEVNLDQVEKFYNVGAASNLDLQRAKAQYSSTLPQLQRAQNDRIISANFLKSILNIPLNDSIIVLDTLSELDFLKDLKAYSLSDFKDIALKQRSEIRMVGFKAKAVDQQRKIAGSRFLPTVALTASVQHQAQLDTWEPFTDKYIRSKQVGVMVQFPLFEGFKRGIEYHQACIASKQMVILKQQTNEQVQLDIEQSYYNYQQSINTLQSLEETLEQAKESLRLANLLYREQISTQLEVLNAQLFYIQSNTQYQQGIYEYNINQLALLRSMGMLKSIWE